VTDVIEEKYPEFKKIPRLFRDCIIQEKIDGTNALIEIKQDPCCPVCLTVRAGQRTKWIPWPNGPDNFGFGRWVKEHETELKALGPGLHFGEWYGSGIQRGYGLSDKRFALFRQPKNGTIPGCCQIVPTLFEGPFSTPCVDYFIQALRENGSRLVPGFMKPEGVVVQLVASGALYKVTLEGDQQPKGVKDAAPGT
jgi:RNA ligase